MTRNSAKILCSQSIAHLVAHEIVHHVKDRKFYSKAVCCMIHNFLPPRLWEDEVTVHVRILSWIESVTTSHTFVGIKDGFYSACQKDSQSYDVSFDRSS